MTHNQLGTPEVGNRPPITVEFAAYPSAPSVQSTGITVEFRMPDQSELTIASPHVDITGPVPGSRVVDGVNVTTSTWVIVPPVITQRGRHHVRVTSSGLAAAVEADYNVPDSPFDGPPGPAPLVVGNFPAAQVSIADAGNLFADGYVEGALQEIARGYDRFTLSPAYGHDLVPRDFVTGTAVTTAVKDKPCWKEFTPTRDMVCTGMSMASSSTAAAGLTFARLVLYHVGRRYGQTGTNTGSYTILARTANDTTLFTSINTVYQRSWEAVGGWPSAVRLLAGERYAVGYQIVGTTAPLLLTNGAAVRPQVTALGVAPYIGGSVGGLGVLTDVPPYWNGASLNASASEGYMPWYNLTLDPDSTLPRPPTVAIMSDSYAASFAGWYGYANATAAAATIPVYNAGVGGETTTQMITRMGTLTARRPRIILIHGGINDVANTVASATITANLTTLINAALAVKSAVVVCTIPPSTSMDAGELVTLAAVNAFILGLAIPGVFVADTGRALTTGDGVTRDAAKYVDGTHPNDAGQAAMGAVLAPVLTAVVASL